MIAPEYRAEAEADARMARDFGTARRIGKSGRLAMRIPADAYYRAIESNGGVSKAGKTCWDDPEFVADMKRHHPHIAPDQEGDIIISLSAGNQPASMRNRHGRVSERIVYRNGQKITIKA